MLGTMRAPLKLMASAPDTKQARETWRPGRLLSEVVQCDESDGSEEFEAVPPSRHDQPTQRRAFRVPMMPVPKF